MSCEGKENKEQGVRGSEEREMECLVSASAEALAERIKSADAGRLQSGRAVAGHGEGGGRVLGRQ